MADITTGFGTVPTKANVLGDSAARPGGTIGNGVPSPDGKAPNVVGDNRLPAGAPVGQGRPSSGGSPQSLGQTRPGGSVGQGTGESRKMKKAAWIAD